MVIPVNVNKLLSSILSSHEVLAKNTMDIAIVSGMKTFLIIVHSFLEIGFKNTKFFSDVSNPERKKRDFSRNFSRGGGFFRNSL